MPVADGSTSGNSSLSAIRASLGSRWVGIELPIWQIALKKPAGQQVHRVVLRPPFLVQTCETGRENNSCRPDTGRIIRLLG